MPRNITVTFGDGTSHTYENTPDSVTPDEVQSRAEKQFFKTVKNIDGGVKFESPTAESPKTGVDAIPTGGLESPEKTNPVTTAEKIAASPPIKMARAFFSPLTGLAEFIPGGAGERMQAYNQEQKDLSARGTAEQHPLTQVLGSTAELGGSMISPTSLAAMKLMPVAQGATGVLNRAVQYGKNVGIGAGTGAVLNSLNPVGKPEEGESFTDAKLKQLLTGAEGGALVNGVLAPIVKMGAGAAGWLKDLITGKLSDVNAGRVIRDAAGPDVDKIKAALRVANQGESAAQSAVSAESPTFSALGARSDEMRSKAAFDRNKQQSQALEDEIAKIAGGRTQSENISATKDSKNALNQITKPMKDSELEMMNETARLKRILDTSANDLEQGAASKVNDVRRFSEAGPRGESMARTDLIEKGLPVGATKYTYLGGDIPTKAGQVATKAANESLALGEGASQLRAMSDKLSASGRNPIDLSPVKNALNDELNNPALTSNDAANTALSKVLSDIAKAEQKNGGVIDAVALDAIRKYSVNSAIEQYLKGSDPATKAKHTAEILAKVRPIIDSAFERAGGSGYKTYLDTHREGMRLIDQMKLGGQALDMLKNSPTEFINLVRGNKPEVVKGIFTGEHDIKNVMGEKFNPMDKVAQALENKQKLSDLSNLGTADLNQILGNDAMALNLPGFLNKYVTAGKLGVRVGENALNKATMNRVYDAMQNPQNAARLMDELPSAEKVKLLRMLRSDKVNAPLISGALSTQN